jgi:hypothetical protein
MQRASTMNYRNKAVLMNLAILIGLIIQYLKGTSLNIVALSGIVIFIFANLLMIFVAKKQTAAKTK